MVVKTDFTKSKMKHQETVIEFISMGKLRQVLSCKDICEKRFIKKTKIFSVE